MDDSELGACDNASLEAYQALRAYLPGSGTGMTRFYCSKTSGLIIPHKCIDLLPFGKTRMSDWNTDGRLREYLVTICDRDGVIVDESGVESPVNYSFYADYVYKWGQERAASYVEKFAASCKFADETKQYDIANSCAFGEMMQYEISWSGTVGAVLSEGAFFSLAHILESEAELQCSVELAQRAFFRQANLVLRCFLEDVFVQLLFCNKPDDFGRWKADDYRIPSFRGRKGILACLLADGVLSHDLADAAASVYGELNGTIHGAQRELLYEGVSEGRNVGPAFTVERFERWCCLFSLCTGIGLRALYEHLVLWEGKKPPDSEFCSTCHEKNSFNYEESRIAGKLIVRRTCKRCGTNLDFLQEAGSEEGFYEVRVEQRADED